jgi:UDP-N-acetylmuramate dehydrogenase
MDLIRWCNRRGLSGLEKMYGIPGSLGGAVVGNAGAYGQEISSCLESVEVRTETGLRILDRNNLDFRYRHSALKDHPGWFLISCILRLRQTGEDLQPASDRILELRETKYPPGLKCPGSFFKNVEAQTLGETVLQNIPSDFITHGKIPAGRLLQEVGACGARSGQAMVAAYHGNLFINLGGASNEDVLRLASHYAGLVFEKYAVRLEPEVLIVPDPAGGIAEFPALSRTRPQG